MSYTPRRAPIIGSEDSFVYRVGLSLTVLELMRKMKGNKSKLKYIRFLLLPHLAILCRLIQLHSCHLYKIIFLCLTPEFQLFVPFYKIKINYASAS